MGGLLTDIRVGIRSLRRTPGFALTAILTLALGIGLATAVFTVADALLLRLLRVLVSGEFFDVLGARPVLGRAMQPSDDVYGAAPVMVLSYGAWQRRFGGDTHVLGRQIVMYEDGVPYTIVGVMPQGLDYPRGSDFWAPVAAAIPPKGLPFVSLHLIGRLAPRATVTA